MNAICPIHGYVKVENFITAINSNVILKNVVWKCPKCGRPAPIADGEYIFNHTGLLTAFKGAKLSQHSLSKLRALTDNIIYNTGTVEELQNGVLAISPRFGETLAPFLNFANNEQFYKWINTVFKPIIIALISIYGAGNINVNVNIGNRTINNFNIQSHNTQEQPKGGGTFKQKLEKETRERNLKRIQELSRKDTLIMKKGKPK